VQFAANSRTRIGAITSKSNIVINIQKSYKIECYHTNLIVKIGLKNFPAMSKNFTPKRWRVWGGVPHKI
jgi:hypothetical protein